MGWGYNTPSQNKGAKEMVAKTMQVYDNEFYHDGKKNVTHTTDNKFIYKFEENPVNGNMLVVRVPIVHETTLRKGLKSKKYFIK